MCQYVPKLSPSPGVSLQQVAEPEAKDAGVKRRIDSGGLRREGLFAAADDWLNESEVSTFITGGAPPETGGETSNQDQEIVKVDSLPRGRGVIRTRSSELN
jgi:hypothetical protein